MEAYAHLHRGDTGYQRAKYSQLLHPLFKLGGLRFGLHLWGGIGTLVKVGQIESVKLWLILPIKQIPVQQQ